MKLGTRRIIMILFILVFFIIAPILIFYASGYRYDIKRNKVFKTSSLMVEAKTITAANLYINDQSYEAPFHEKIFIYNLLPGEYQLKLEKEGFHPWQKKITITSSLTTFAKDIILFQKNVPLQIIEGQVTNFYLSPDQQKIVYLLETDSFLELYFLNLATKERSLLYRIPQQEKIVTLSWAASSKKILFKVENDYLVFDIQNLNQSIELNEIIDFEAANFKWDIQSDNLLYAQSQDSIYKINLLAQTSELFFKPENKKEINPEFFIEANDIFYIQREEVHDVLYKYNLNFQTNKKVLELNQSNNNQFIKSNNNFLGLIDLDQQKLFLIQKIITDLEIDIKGDQPIQEFKAKNALWDKSEKQLLIYDDFEISTYNTETSDEFFINRYGQQIKKVSWYPKLQHIVILFEDSLKIIDLSLENGNRNVTGIVEFDQLKNFYLDNKGETIYFNGQIGRQQGLYQIEIK